jgi:glycerophosphoryl diester phosphodiesterase
MKYSGIILLFLIGTSLLSQANYKKLSQILNEGNDQVLICGHRGGFYPSMPENSMQLMQYIRENINPVQPIMFEIDIREDKTGKLWLMHDSNLQRTTNGSGEILNYDSLSVGALMLKDQLGNLTKFKVPAYLDVLKWAKKNNVYLMLDVKRDTWEKVIFATENANLTDRCVVLTFSPQHTDRVSGLSKNIMISALVTSYDEFENIARLRVPVGQLFLYVTNETPHELVKFIKNAGYVTLSDPRELFNNFSSPHDLSYYNKMVTDLGLNILVTDFPIELSKKPDRQLKERINDIHMKKFNWMINAQIDSLDNILHKDVYYIHSNGWKETKSELIQNLKSEKLKYVQIKIHQSEVRTDENAAIVTGKGTFNVSLDGKDIELNLYYTEVYIIGKEGIKLISRHACKY